MKQNAETPLSIEISKAILGVNGPLYILFSLGMIAPGLFASGTLLIIGVLYFAWGVSAVILFGWLRPADGKAWIAVICWAGVASLLHSIEIARAIWVGNESFLSIFFGIILILLVIPLPFYMVTPKARNWCGPIKWPGPGVTKSDQFLKKASYR